MEMSKQNFKICFTLVKLFLRLPGTLFSTLSFTEMYKDRLCVAITNYEVKIITAWAREQYNNIKLSSLAFVGTLGHFCLQFFSL